MGMMVSALAHGMRSCARHYPAQFQKGADRLDAHIGSKYPRLAVAMASAPWANYARELGEFNVNTVESQGYRAACESKLDSVQALIGKRNPSFVAYLDAHWK